jgi:hypothetical protein
VSAFARQIGPRKVGGRYYNGYSDEEYTVLELETNRTTWPLWQITVRWKDTGRVTSHCTDWDPDKDKVMT